MTTSETPYYKLLFGDTVRSRRCSLLVYSKENIITFITTFCIFLGVIKQKTMYVSQLQTFTDSQFIQ